MFPIPDIIRVILGGFGGVESKINVQLFSLKLYISIVLIMPEIVYHFNFSHGKPFIINCNYTNPSILILII